MSFIEVHDVHKTSVAGEEHVFAAGSALFGLRYLSDRETTFIVEYYHNGTGYSRSEMLRFYEQIERAERSYRVTHDERALRSVAGLAGQGYASASPMKNYMYLRIAQKEPFDILYFTPAFTTI
jgi:hypothetical protein